MMAPDDPFAHPLNALVLETFRLNGALVAIGDGLTAPIGLSTARWQVLGAIAAEQDEPTVSRLARSMGLARQSVQRVVDDLARAGLVDFDDNPHHKRARLVRFTSEGRARFDAATALWAPIAERLRRLATDPALESAAVVLRTVRRELERIDHGDIP